MWPDGIPVWASRRWTSFKEKLPAAEGWNVWIEWYEARLVGQRCNEELELARATISEKEWAKGPAHVNGLIQCIVSRQSGPIALAIAHGFEKLEATNEVVDLSSYAARVRRALPDDPSQVVGTTKEMLEATMKTILDRRGCTVKNSTNFPSLVDQCFSELDVAMGSDSNAVAEIATAAKGMILAANKLRNQTGTGHGRIVGQEPTVVTADAALVASTGMVLAAWLLHLQEQGRIR